MIILNKEDIHKFVDFYDEITNKIKYHELIEIIDSPPFHLYSITFMICSVCKYTNIVLHPIPIKYPTQCKNCNQMSCYIDETCQLKWENIWEEIFKDEPTESI